MTTGLTSNDIKFNLCYNNHEYTERLGDAVNHNYKRIQTLEAVIEVQEAEIKQLREELRHSRQEHSILVESLDNEIKQLREALQKIDFVLNFDGNKAAQYKEARQLARSALQQKDSE